MFEELQSALVGYSTVLKGADTLLTGHDVFRNTFRARVLEKLVCCKIQQDVIRAIRCMTR